jgi:hypothetical protein
LGSESEHDPLLVPLELVVWPLLVLLVVWPLLVLLELELLAPHFPAVHEREQHCANPEHAPPFA